jgi:arylsulfatase A-like enzyme
MRTLVHCLCCMALTVLLVASCEKESPSPNVIFFLADDLGWSQTMAYGSSYYRTPSIDRLAGEGIRFTDAYAACGVCSPTRASIMTGKYPARLHGSG